jgi:hypothetical protein
MERWERSLFALVLLLLLCLACAPCFAQTPTLMSASPLPAPPPQDDNPGQAFPPPLLPQAPLLSQTQAADNLPPGAMASSASRDPASAPRSKPQGPPQEFPPPRPSQKSSLELMPPPGGEVIKIDLPPREAGDLCFPINLATALRLADGRPLIVASAQASAWVAEAKYQKARVLWVPSFMSNVCYMRHDGYGPDFNGGINVPQGINALGQPAPGSFGKPLNQNLNWFIAGFSLYQAVATTDAIFQPLAQRQDLNAKRWGIQAAKNDALLQTAQAYFNVHHWRGTYAGNLYCVELGRQLLKKISDLSRDLVPAIEIDRASNLLAYLEQQAVSAREQWRVASADLTQVLRLDPRAVVEPLELDHLQMTLIDPDRSLDDLIPIGLTNRPELAAQQATIQAAAVRIRQEKLRPLLPAITITGWQTPGGMPTEAGIFGTGNGGKMNLWNFRDDISTQLFWQFQNMGFGNAALVKKRRGEESQALAALFHLQDSVVSEITQSQARLQSAAARVVQAERALQTGLVTFQKNLEGLGQTRRFENVLDLIYEPQEAVYALRLLQIAFDEYYATVAEYNAAQFELFHALGYPARELSFVREAGELTPTETARPAYLPPVGTGPPPPPR